MHGVLRLFACLVVVCPHCSGCSWVGGLCVSRWVVCSSQGAFGTGSSACDCAVLGIGSACVWLVDEGLDLVRRIDVGLLSRCLLDAFFAAVVISLSPLPLLFVRHLVFLAIRASLSSLFTLFLHPSRLFAVSYAASPFRSGLLRSGLLWLWISFVGWIDLGIFVLLISASCGIVWALFSGRTWWDFAEVPCWMLRFVAWISLCLPDLGWGCFPFRCGLLAVSY